MESKLTVDARVVLLHNFLTPYRVPLFTELARRFDLEVWILGDIAKLREWKGEAPQEAFRRRHLPRLDVPFGSRYNALLLNYTLPRELRAAKFDVLIACGWDAPAFFWAGYHCRKTGRPFVLWSGSTAAERSWYRTVTLPAVKSLVRCANAWIAYGTRAKEYLVSLGAREEKTFCAYNTVELDYFATNAALSDEERVSLRRQLSISTEYVALYCGNLLKMKGITELLQGFAAFSKKHDNVTLLLVGSGRDKTYFETLARTLGIDERVVFVGYVDRASLPRYYGIADILVHPSHSEVWGLVINEALACGVPVIATEVCGAVADLLRHGENGFIIPVKSPRAISDALAQFFELPPAEQQAMRAAARAAVAPYTIQRAADAFVSAVRCALEES
ncbi:MAG TPA: glycosyltransferase [Candidatus Hydrogenedentes bacterium]|nr:glycosyltransferase [Candidatus Hydrogenedentota bacterium]HOL76346.1 glycosyltransferase [Candidatus Hydrogenedentota bacterium]HPO86173.1 glycosyltransferase [Candidatus Hydrogenedentota bacterium]